MIVTCVNIWVKTEYIEDFKVESIKNHNNSVKEIGNLRFDILQNTNDPCRFTLYEAYKTKIDAANHKETAHYLEWKKNVAPMMAQPREGLSHKVIAPIGTNKWS